MEQIKQAILYSCDTIEKARKIIEETDSLTKKVQELQQISIQSEMLIKFVKAYLENN